MKMLNDTIEGLINYRIAQEELSSRIYRAMSIALGFYGYAGASALWMKYSNEELVHAEVAYKYLLDLDIMPTVPALEAPDFVFKSLPDVCKKSYDHEVDITKQCNELAIQAQKDQDYKTLQLAEWYLKEQVEEIGKTTYWLDRIDAFGDSKEALRLLDNEMGCKV